MAITVAIFQSIENQIYKQESCKNEQEWLIRLFKLFITSQAINTFYFAMKCLFERTRCCIRSQNCIGLIAAINLALVFSMGIILIKGFFINWEIKEPDEKNQQEIECKSIHYLRLFLLFFGFFFVVMLLCVIAAFCVLLSEEIKKSKRRVTLVKAIKAIPYGNLVF